MIKLFISEGCTFRCSYCAEIKAFPEYKSFPLSKIVEEAKRMVEKTGEKRLCLWSDDTGAYGTDIGLTLPDLLDALVKEIAGAKISIIQINPFYWNKYKDRILQHVQTGTVFQIEAPIQSANNRVLELMKRPYTNDELRGLFGPVKGIAGFELLTHMIVGFPSETEEEFMETLNFILEFKPRWVLTSAYMSVPDTVAACMEHHLSGEERYRRIQYAYEKMKKMGIVCTY
ncbi:MAG TPA: radical SAM protein, partial [Paludibacter sp.]|nr:radical SAM protein [Paludibacter sp.]